MTALIPFSFDNQSVRSTVIDGEPWFVARDVCAALHIGWRGDTLEAIKSEWRGMRKYRTPQINQHGQAGTVEQELIVISEPAVYKLAFRSRKAAAERFTDWLASEVLPAIRKTGSYTAPQTITPAQQRAIQEAVSARVADVPPAQRSTAYKALYGHLKTLFRVGSYTQIPAEHFNDVIEAIESAPLLIQSNRQPEALPPPASGMADRYLTTRTANGGWHHAPLSKGARVVSCSDQGLAEFVISLDGLAMATLAFTVSYHMSVMATQHRDMARIGGAR